MKSRMLLLMVVAIALMVPGVLLGTELWPVAAYQPFDMPDGIALSPVTYLGYYSPETSIEATGWQNRARRPESKSYMQENAAYTAGLRVTGGVQGSDTITATINAGRLASFHSANGSSDTLLLAATVECVKANAGQLGAHVLRLSIIGVKRYRHYGGTFDLAAYRCGPQSRQLTEAVHR